MQRDIAAGDFIEHAEFSGNLYGTRWAEFDVGPASWMFACVIHKNMHGVYSLSGY